MYCSTSFMFVRVCIFMFMYHRDVHVRFNFSISSPLSPTSSSSCSVPHSRSPSPSPTQSFSPYFRISLFSLFSCRLLTFARVHLFHHPHRRLHFYLRSHLDFRKYSNVLVCNVVPRSGMDCKCKMKVNVSCLRRGPCPSLCASIHAHDIVHVRVHIRVHVRSCIRSYSYSGS